MSNGERGELILHVFIQDTCIYIQESQNLKKFQLCLQFSKAHFPLVFIKTSNYLCIEWMTSVPLKSYM